MFTGDRSGDWLYRSLFRAGFGNQPTSTGRDDGLELFGTWITAPVRCAPPANKPTPAERDNCSEWLSTELDLLPNATVFVCLGAYAYQSLWRHLGDRVNELPRPRPKFGHGIEIDLEEGPVVLLSYHPSQQNTFTGKLTESMLDAVFARAAALTD